jgi:sugar phosphate isomerase/epimerase
MRLGGPIFSERKDPESWVHEVRREGYRAVVSPIGNDADEQLVADFRAAAQEIDILIAEVGAWSNPISPNRKVRESAIEHCKKQLDLAERLGARSCINIAGSRGEQWDGPHPDNFSLKTFEMIVDVVREIIDAVKPKHTFYALETMPWAFPDSAESYLELVKAIDRPHFGVHVDPVNMISSPRVYYNNGQMIKDFFEKLGPYIKNAHAKDIHLFPRLTVHLEEVIPGAGALDYTMFLRELNKLGPDTPLIIEHLSSEEEYRKAAAFIRSKATELNIAL